MRISELPEPYKSLAESRRDADEFSQKTNLLSSAFSWRKTKEGRKFWRDVDNAVAVTDLPMVPSLEPSLLTACKWLVSQLQGESGAGHSHWEQFPEYRAALEAIAKAEGGRS